MNLLGAVHGMMPFAPMYVNSVMKWKWLIWAVTFPPLFALYLVLAIFFF
jgi:hypothetical protein